VRWCDLAKVGGRVQPFCALFVPAGGRRSGINRSLTGPG
jgi:hypothetical protein